MRGNRYYVGAAREFIKVVGCELYGQNGALKNMDPGYVAEVSFNVLCQAVGDEADKINHVHDHERQYKTLFKSALNV